MTRRKAIFTGLIIHHGYNQPTMCFEQDGKPLWIGLPVGETMDVVPGQEVEFFYERRVWTMIWCGGVVVVRNPAAHRP